ncbi:hypothetical protein HPB47_002775, partial [Ixodes persulcatus]
MCGPVNFLYPADFAEQGSFFRDIVCPGLHGVPVGDGQASKGFRDLTGPCSHRDLGLVIPCKSRPPDNGGPVQGQSGPRGNVFCWPRGRGLEPARWCPNRMPAPRNVGSQLRRASVSASRTRLAVVRHVLRMSKEFSVVETIKTICVVVSVRRQTVAEPESSNVILMGDTVRNYPWGVDSGDSWSRVHRDVCIGVANSCIWRIGSVMEDCGHDGTGSTGGRASVDGCRDGRRSGDRNGWRYVHGGHSRRNDDI